jgi:hypothetical protein
VASAALPPASAVDSFDRLGAQGPDDYVGTSNVNAQLGDRDLSKPTQAIVHFSAARPSVRQQIPMMRRLSC